MTRCPSCSAEVPSTGQFCNRCGARQAAAAEPATETTLKTPAGPRPSSPGSLDSTGGARFLPGTLLSERYRIVGMLGRGGMGEVYRADDLKLGQPVALKFLPESLERDPSRLARLLNEVRLARQVSHPNVCRVYDVGELDGSHFMAMEYVDGEDLSSLLRRIGRLPHEKALEIARQICAGLAAAHEQGILHRDLKPANVMIDGRGRVKLTDFGLAGLAETIERRDVRSGTPAYMAPEQLSGREVTLRSDIYSLGLVLYEIFTGKPAFRGKSGAEIARLQQQTAPTSPSSLVSDMDEIVEQVILRCLEKEPRARPMSALAVSAALPGGDPLAAALAAGETPSPEMVAEAGAAGGLRPAIAVGALLAIFLSVALAGIRAPVPELHERLPMDASPDELASRAERVLEDLGLEDPGPHRRRGFEPYANYLEWIREHEESRARWQRLESGRPPGIRFWFRYAASEMIPDDVHGFFVASHDPAQRLPGQGRLLLDLQGRLLGLDVVPPEHLEAGNDPVDWSRLFAAAELDPGGFVETPPVRPPATACDELRAWRGPVFGESEGIVQAGSVGGSATYFEVLGQWDVDDEGTEPDSFGGLVFGLLAFVIIVGAMVLARRNLKAGRSDRSGAAKVMLFFVLAILGTWFLTEVRLETLAAGSLFAELVFGRLLGHALLHAWLAGLLYVALEPYVRRLWPETLVSWSRLLMGRLRDPLVGRDLLLGMAALGILVTVSTWYFAGLMRWFEVPYRVETMFLTPALGGVRYALATTLIHAEQAVSFSMTLLVLLLLARLLLRRTWAAVTVAVCVPVVVSFLSTGPEPDPLAFRVLVLLIPALVAAAIFGLMLRLGLLSVIGGLLMASAVDRAPITWDLSSWYAGPGLVAVIGVSGLALWAFYISLAGRRLLGDALLDEHGR